MGNPGYTVLRTDRGQACGVRDLPQAELRRLLDDPAALLWQNLHQPVKIDHSSLIVVAELPLVHGTTRVAYRRYRPRNRLKALLALFRRAPATRAWQWGHGLLARGIATARPIAMYRPRGLSLSGTSYLATQWIEGAENLHLCGWRLAKLPLEPRLRSAGRCAESLGRLLGRMHASGLAHRDLKGANLLVAPQGNQLAAYLIDLDGLRACRRLSRRRRAADLARLAVSLSAHPWVTRTVCRRFLRAYVRQCPSGTVAWKPLWRDVAARSRRIVLAKRRSGQEVL